MVDYKNKMAVNGTKSSSALHSDLGGNSDFGGHSDLGDHSNLGVTQIGSHSDLGWVGHIRLVGIIGTCIWQCQLILTHHIHIHTTGSVAEVKCLFASGIKTIHSDAKLQQSFRSK